MPVRRRSGKKFSRKPRSSFRKKYSGSGSIRKRFSRRSSYKKKRSSMRSRRPTGSSGPSVGVSRYAAALLDPFNEKGHGAQVPDLYSFPTSAKHVTSSFQVTLNGNGDARGGNFSLVILPHPIQTVWAHQQSGVNTISILTGGGSVTPTSSIANTLGGCVGSLFSQASLKSFFDKYRVVGMGARITNLMSATTATGRLYFCTMPCPKHLVPSSAVFNCNPLSLTPLNTVVGSHGAIGMVPVCQKLGLPAFDGADQYAGMSQNILSLATGGEIPLPALIQNGFEWRNKIVGPDAYSFRSADLRPAVDSSTIGQISITGGGSVAYIENPEISYTYATDGYTTSTAAAFQNQMGGYDYDMVGGWECLCIRGSGFPYGSSTVVLNIDITMHLEGTEDVVIGTSVGFASDATIPPVEPGALQALQTVSARMPSVKPCASGSSLAMTLPIRGY